MPSNSYSVILSTILFVFLLFPLSCKEIDEDKSVPLCLTNQAFFNQYIDTPILQKNCYNCHNSQGLAAQNSFQIKSYNDSGYLADNLAIYENFAKIKVNGTSIILLKANGQLNHAGGKLYETNSDEYSHLRDMVFRTEHTMACTDSNRPGEFLSSVELESDQETMYKVALSLGGRLPTAAEEQGTLNNLIDTLLEEENFYIRLKEIYNNILLTDKYLNSSSFGIDLPSITTFPNATYYQDYAVGSTARTKLREWANWGVSREPLELIAYVATNNRPFTEILTADYFMVTPYSATVFGVPRSQLDSFQKGDPTDDYNQYESQKNHFSPVQVTGIPHSGFLTSPMFLQRFPSTNTNRNRHRARIIFQNFLATDVLAIGERVLDQSAVTQVNPTLNDSQCTTCHVLIDPLSGAFKNWDNEGRYRATNWYNDMRAPGYSEQDQLPTSNADAAVRWISQKIVADSRFVLATIYTIYQGLTGFAPLGRPTDVEENGAWLAYRTQNQFFQTVAAKFIASNYNIKIIFKELINSYYYRAKNGPNGSETMFDQIGMGHILTPEQLDRKIEAVTGYPWLDRSYIDPNKRRNLLADYNILYGGIDSDSVTDRVTELNGIMASVQLRMANEMSCITVPHDLSRPVAKRTLFPYVEKHTEPIAQTGGDALVQQNILYLHKRILGQDLALDDPEVQATYQLFNDVWIAGKAAMLKGDESTNLNSWCRATTDFFTGNALSSEREVRQDANYVVRSWVAVINYMLGDYSFLYE